MTPGPLFERTQIVGWVRALVVIFVLLGLSFGTWLSRLPAVRDQLGATTVEMSLYGLCLAAGSLVGLVASGSAVTRLGPKRTIGITVVAQCLALPSGIAVLLAGSLPVGLALLFLYGAAFSTADVAMNVSGAGAERSLGRSRLPLMHAGYSLGTVSAMGLGAAAEALGVAVELHFLLVFGAVILTLALVLGRLPTDEAAVRRAAEHAGRDIDPAGIDAAGVDAAGNEPADGGADCWDATGPVPVIDSSAGHQPAFATLTGSMPIVGSEHGSVSPGDAPVSPGYRPWRDRRVLLVGVIALTTGLVEGTAADWLPLALVDGRGVSNEVGATMLGVFFASILASRLAGSLVLGRLGRVAVLRSCAALSALGVVTVILVPGLAGIIAGTIAWGFGAGLGWPVAISAAADRAETAARDVAVVSSIGYASMLLGPMAFGVLGNAVGLLTAFWALLLFALLGGLLAGAARPPWQLPGGRTARSDR